jgi:hypothetical protein
MMRACTLAASSDADEVVSKHSSFFAPQIVRYREDRSGPNRY